MFKTHKIDWLIAIILSITYTVAVVYTHHLEAFLYLIACFTMIIAFWGFQTQKRALSGLTSDINHKSERKDPSTVQSKHEQIRVFLALFLAAGCFVYLGFLARSWDSTTYYSVFPIAIIILGLFFSFSLSLISIIFIRDAFGRKKG